MSHVWVCFVFWGFVAWVFHTKKWGWCSWGRISIHNDCNIFRTSQMILCNSRKCHYIQLKPNIYKEDIVNEWLIMSLLYTTWVTPLLKNIWVIFIAYRIIYEQLQGHLYSYDLHCQLSLLLYPHFFIYETFMEQLNHLVTLGTSFISKVSASERSRGTIRRSWSSRHRMEDSRDSRNRKHCLAGGGYLLSAMVWMFVYAQNIFFKILKS